MFEDIPVSESTEDEETVHVLPRAESCMNGKCTPSEHHRDMDRYSNAMASIIQRGFRAVEKLK